MHEIRDVHWRSLVARAFGLLLLASLSSTVRAQQATDNSARELDTRRTDMLRRALNNPRISNPQSVQIRNVFVSDRNAICGEMSYRDRFGGIAPFVSFSVDPTGRLDVPGWGTTLPGLARLKYRQTCRRPIY